LQQTLCDQHLCKIILKNHVYFLVFFKLFINYFHCCSFHWKIYTESSVHFCISFQHVTCCSQISKLYSII
ncbi:hypothetical protein T4B_9029, partial [Trichinella pseudospiralis]